MMSVLFFVSLVWHQCYSSPSLLWCQCYFGVSLPWCQCYFSQLILWRLCYFDVSLVWCLCYFIAQCLPIFIFCFLDQSKSTHQFTKRLQLLTKRFRNRNGLKTMLDALVKISPRNMQPVPTNCHFCHRCEAFLGGHFCHTKFIPRLSCA